MGAPVLFSHGSSNARGVEILIKNSLNITIQQSEISSDGRFIVLTADINKTLLRRLDAGDDAKNN